MGRATAERITIVVLLYYIVFIQNQGYNVGLNEDTQNSSSSILHRSKSNTYFHLRHPNEYPRLIDPRNPIIINLGLPRTGTTTWVEMVKVLYPTEPEVYHISDAYSTVELGELLSLGNRSDPSNALYRKLTSPPKTVRAMADHPAFLFAPIAKDFPHVYFVQVTREVESHIKSTRYMMGKWLQDRCLCHTAPRCQEHNLALLDRLYYNKYNALGHMCRHGGNPESIPKDLLYEMLTQESANIQQLMHDHPKFLAIKLEDGVERNLKKMAIFLGLNASEATTHDIHLNRGQ